MLDRIIYFSIKNKIIIGLFTASLIIWGIYSFKQLPIDAVPDITNNQVQVITVSPSLAAQEIERLVSFPVEQTMATIPDIVEIRSLSRFGLSVVTVVFSESTDVYWARQQVNERLSEAKNLIPGGIGSPELAPVTTGLGEIYQYVLRPKAGYENNFNATELRTIQDWIVRRQLLGTEGVADVSSFGGFLKQYEIALDPDRLRSMEVSMAEIFTALEKNNQNTGGAYIDKNPKAYFIRTEGLLRSIEDIENIVVKNTHNGTPILISHVADVKTGNAIRYGAMTSNAEGEVVGAIVMMLKGENSSKVIKNVKERIAQIEKTLPEGLEIKPFLDRTKLVNNAISTVSKNLIEGALIVIFVLVLLLGNLRAGLVVASVIPLAMLFAISLMNLFGVSGNLMSLGAIDFGLIVDGAVIIVEATLHHLAGNQLQRKLNNAEINEEVFTAAKKIRGSAAFGEIIILIVYLPILALTGIEGKMFKPMAQTVSFAILGAFILSLTYVPMMSALCLSRETKHKKNISDSIMNFIQKLYTPVLQLALKKKTWVLTLSVLLFTGSVWLFTNMGGEFIPSLDEGDFALETRVLTGSSISKTIDATLKTAAVLKNEFPEVKEVIGKIGAAEIPTDPMPVESCDLMVILKDRDEWTSATTKEELAQKMSAALQKVPGVTYGFLQPIQMRFNELMTGARQDVVVKVYGEDLDKLSMYAQQISKVVSTIKGATDLYEEKVSGLPQLMVSFDREKIARYGLNIEDINTVIRTGFAGEKAGMIYEGEKRFDLVVRLDKINRKNIDDLKNLSITTSNGKSVPIEQLADIEFKPGPNQIQRDEAKRRITIGFNVRGRDVESIVKELQQKIETEVKFEAGYYPTYGGTFKNLEEARDRLSIAVPVALFLIFLLLYFTFGSVKQSFLIFTAIPLSAIGGIVALWLRGMPFSISAGIGFIALFGVAVLNGIVLIGEFNRLRDDGLESLHQIVLQATSIRLRPVVMTALVASLGFFPMAFSNGTGAEVQKPLATVVIGGLVTATLLTLLVLPVIYILSEKIKPAASIGKKLTTLILLMVIPTFMTKGQQVAVISLQQAIDMAKKNNPAILAGKQEVDYYKYLKQGSVNLGKTSVNYTQGQFNSVLSDNNLTISQSIPFPGTFIQNAGLHEAQMKLAELKSLQTQNELVYKVKQTYCLLSYYYATNKLLLREDSLYHSIYKAIDLNYKTGESGLPEKTAIEIDQSEVKNKLSQNRTSIRMYNLILQTLIQSKQAVVIDSSNFSPLALEIKADSASIQQNAFLSMLHQEVEVAKKEKKLLVQESLPDFNIGFFSQTIQGYSNPLAPLEYFDATKRFKGLHLGINIPLWYLTHYAKIHASTTKASIHQLQANAYQQQLYTGFLEELTIYLNLRRDLENYLNLSLPKSRLLLTQSQTAFSKGEIDCLRHSMNVKNYLNINNRYLHLLNAINQQVLKLELLCGSKN